VTARRRARFASPEDVFVSVASPLAPGASSVAARTAWKRLREVPEPNTASEMTTAKTAAAAAATRTGRRGPVRGRKRRCASMRARRPAGTSTSAAALRASAGRGCSCPGGPLFRQSYSPPGPALEDA
jgi:hypothetical protein